MWMGRLFSAQSTAMRDRLLPGRAERDEGFRRQIERLAQPRSYRRPPDLRVALPAARAPAEAA